MSVHMSIFDLIGAHAHSKFTMATEIVGGKQKGGCESLAS